VVGIADSRERDAAFARLVDRARHRVVRRRMPEAVARVEQQRRGGVAHGLVPRPRRDAAVADAIDVEPAQPRDAVRLDAAPVRRDEHVAGDARLLGIDADRREGALDERGEIVLANANRVSQR